MSLSRIDGITRDWLHDREAMDWSRRSFRDWRWLPTVARHGLGACAQSTAYLSLPARKEGIIPAMANLRLPRFLSERLARNAIMLGARIDCDSPTGRMICDQVVADGEIDEALTALVHDLTDSGIVSAVGNRRQFGNGQEPLDLFREYLALFAKEQAACHFSSGLISNLERYWNAQSR